MSVVLYSKDNCQNCAIVKTLLNQHEIGYELIHNPLVDDISKVAKEFNTIIRSFPFATFNGELFTFANVREDVDQLISRIRSHLVELDIKL